MIEFPEYETSFVVPSVFLAIHLQTLEWMSLGHQTQWIRRLNEASIALDFRLARFEYFHAVTIVNKCSEFPLNCRTCNSLNP